MIVIIFFFNDTATTEIYTLSLHDALPICGYAVLQVNFRGSTGYGKAYLNAGDREWGGKMHDDLIDAKRWAVRQGYADRSEEHTSELQSRQYLVCRLLLEKKKKQLSLNISI